MSVYTVNNLPISADNPPEAAKLARLLGETGFPSLIVRPTVDEQADAALNSAKALAKLSADLIQELKRTH